MTVEPELPDEVYEKLESLCDQANDLMDSEDFQGALAVLKEGLELIPEPHEEWEAATWLHATMGDAHFALGSSLEALNAFEKAKKCPGGIGNPFVHLRLGQLKFDAEKLDDAADELMRAYMEAGNEIFEDEDEKYFEFLKSRAKID